MNSVTKPAFFFFDIFVVQNTILLFLVLPPGAFYPSMIHFHFSWKSFEKGNYTTNYSSGHINLCPVATVAGFDVSQTERLWSWRTGELQLEIILRPVLAEKLLPLFQQLPMQPPQTTVLRLCNWKHLMSHLWILVWLKGSSTVCKLPPSNITVCSVPTISLKMEVSLGPSGPYHTTPDYPLAFIW